MSRFYGSLCILEALLRRVLYCGHSTQYSHLVNININVNTVVFYLLSKL